MKEATPATLDESVADLIGADNVALLLRAIELYASDDIAIDVDAEVSHGADGAWVQAWVFVASEKE
jgi:hypothetical protein